MKQFCLCFILCSMVFLSGQGQNSFIHINTESLDKAHVECQGESLKNASEDEILMINYNPVIPFDGKQDYMEIIQDIPDLSQVTIFTVFKSDNQSMEDAEVWGLHSEETSLGLTTKRVYSPGGQSYYTGAKPGRVVLNTFSQSHASSLPYPNKRTFVSLGKSNNGTSEAIFKGGIAEIIAYRKRVRGKERQKIETALAIKYGITLTNDKNYITSDKKVIWDREEAYIYSNNIAGIGRDDAMGVYQRQSSSSNVPGFIVIGVGEISISNAKNPSTINDSDFLVWGDNGEELILEPKDKTTNNLQLLQRRWLIKSSGSTSNTIGTQLKIDGHLLFDGLKEKDEYLLVIDGDGSGDFSPENVRFVSASSVSETGIVTFDNIVWDTDNSGKDVFSFAMNKEPKIVSTDGKSNIKVFELLPNLSLDGNYRIIVETAERTEVNVKIFNLQGIQVSNFEFIDEREIDIIGHHLDIPGLYHVVLETPQETVSKKLIIE